MTSTVLTRNNVKVSGAGTQPLLFAHGFGCDQNMWRYVAPAFENRYRVVLFDYVGSGRSDPGAYNAKRYGSLDGYAQDVLEVAEALALEDVVLVGHSISAMIGVMAAIREPARFDRLILMAPSPRHINAPPHYHGGFERADLEGLLEMMEKNYMGWASYLAPVVTQNPARPELAGELERSFCATNPDAARRFAEVTFFSDSRSALGHVTTPSLIMQCSEDALAPPSVGHYLHRHLHRSMLRVLEATGHCPHLSHPEETIRVMREYLDAPLAG